VLRGLHFQKGEFSQSKLVRVIKGKVLDPFVDLEKGIRKKHDWYQFKLNE